MASSSIIEKMTNMIEKYMDKVGVHANDIYYTSSGEFELKYYDNPDPININQLMQKLKNASLNPTLYKTHDREEHGYIDEDERDSMLEHWYDITIKPNWGDTGDLLDNNGKVIKIEGFNTYPKSLSKKDKIMANNKTTTDQIMQAALKAKIAAKLRGEDDELHLAIRQYVDRHMDSTKKMAEGEMLTVSVAKEINKLATNLYKGLSDLEAIANELEGTMKDAGFNNAPDKTLAKGMWDVIEAFFPRAMSIRDRVGTMRMSLFDVINATGGANNDDFAPDGGSRIQSSTSNGVNSQNYRD